MGYNPVERNVWGNPLKDCPVPVVIGLNGWFITVGDATPLNPIGIFSRIVS